MKRKMISMLSLILVFSMVFSVSVLGNTDTTVDGSTSTETTAETTTDSSETTTETSTDSTLETEAETDTPEAAPKGGQKSAGDREKARKGLENALGNVKDTPAASIISGLLEQGSSVEEIAQGLEDVAVELETQEEAEGDNEVIKQERENVKKVADALLAESKSKKEKGGNQQEVFKQLVDVYDSLGSTEDAMNVQIEVIKDDFKNLDNYKKLGELESKTGEDDIEAFVNGEQTNFDVPPVVKSGRTLVPFRAISQSLMAEVSWDPTEQSITVVKDGVEVKLILGSKTAYVNGQEVTLDIPAEVIEGRTVVPVRFIAEAFGAIVQWESTSETIVVYEK
jgi:hypothetical protein